MFHLIVETNMDPKQKNWARVIAGASVIEQGSGVSW